jgi:exopolyphosphatase / guanosine-5'-triphosphate,3'-diphosphate pyrophosphatase
MRVAVLDVGSNTLRLLVCEQRTGGIRPVREARSLLLLGREIERRGALSARKLEETRRCAHRFSRLAREAGAARLEVVVTAPGRQSANADALVRVLAEATAAPVRVLTPEEEGHLAWQGAVSSAAELAPTVAVCDVGGGSTEVLVGTPEGGPAWACSLDIGCLRLTERLLDRDPPGKERMRAAEDEVEAALDGWAIPLPRAALATGGTARALRKLVGERLGEEELGAAVRRLRKTSASEVAGLAGVDRERARTLAAGALIFVQIQRRLGTPLLVSPAGLREGLALALFREAAAA